MKEATKPAADEPKVPSADELKLPLDRRAKVKTSGDAFLEDVNNFKTLEGVEEEFLYEIPGDLRMRALQFEADLKGLDRESALTPSEVSVACGIFRKARLAAENRRFMQLADWLAEKEGWWKTTLHWRKHSYGTALVLLFIGTTTGFGTNVRRWLVSIVVIVIGFAGLAYTSLDYQQKHQSFGNSLYWSVITMSTVGYGDITPKDSAIPEILAACEAVIGLVMFIGLGMLISEKVKRS